MKICTDIAPILIQAAITIDAAREGMNIEIRPLGKDAPMALAAKGDGVGWICVALGMSRGNQQQGSYKPLWVRRTPSIWFYSKGNCGRAGRSIGLPVLRGRQGSCVATGVAPDEAGG